MIRILVIGVALATGALIVLAENHRPAGGASNNQDAPSGVQWEYLVVQGSAVNLNPSGSSTLRKEREGFARENFVLEQNMDKMGAKGWELVDVSGNAADPTLVFKRRK